MVDMRYRQGGLFGQSIGALALCLSLLAAHTPPKAILRDIKPAPPVPAEKRSPALVRAHAVAFDFRLFNCDGRATKPLEVRMNLFPDVDIPVTWTPADGGVWHGSVRGIPNASATLICSGKRVTANVDRATDAMYRIETNDAGVVWVFEIQRSKLPTDR